MQKLLDEAKSQKQKAAEILCQLQQEQVDERSVSQIASLARVSVPCASRVIDAIMDDGSLDHLPVDRRIRFGGKELRPSKERDRVYAAIAYLGETHLAHLNHKPPRTAAEAEYQSVCREAKLNCYRGLLRGAEAYERFMSMSVLGQLAYRVTKMDPNGEMEREHEYPIRGAVNLCVNLIPLAQSDQLKDVNTDVVKAAIGHLMEIITHIERHYVDSQYMPEFVNYSATVLCGLTAVLGDSDRVQMACDRMIYSLNIDRVKSFSPRFDKAQFINNAYTTMGLAYIFDPLIGETMTEQLDQVLDEQDSTVQRQCKQQYDRVPVRLKRALENALLVPRWLLKLAAMISLAAGVLLAGELGLYSESHHDRLVGSDQLTRNPGAVICRGPGVGGGHEV